MPRLSARAKRRVVARLLEVPARAEGRYVRSLRRLAKQMHKQVLASLPRRADADLPDGFDELVEGLLLALQSAIGPLFDRHARGIEKAHKRAMGVIGLPQAHDVGVRAAIAARREENIRLIVDAGRSYAASVRDIVEDPENVGVRVEDIVSMLEERGEVYGSRAELIARDQTLKLNGAITEIRQRNAGVDSYTWSTSLDERVRDTHAALEGQVFSWSSPPDVGHPGQDFQCRCVALPVIEGLEDV